MKQRVISAIVMIALVVPIFIIGGNLYKLAIFVIAMLGMKEYLDIKETKKELPIFIKLMAYLFVPMVLLTVDVNNKLVMTVDFRVITSLIIVLLLLDIFLFFYSYISPTIINIVLMNNK